MRIGIPKGLLYYKYYPFLETFFREIGGEVIISEDTNKDILNKGVIYSVDEACLPMKIFHGHVASLKDISDVIVIPRVMQLSKNEYICPKFCGLPEMVGNSIENIPSVIGEPIYATSERRLYKWAKIAGGQITRNRQRIKKAFQKGLIEQGKYKPGISDKGYLINIALVGHPYNIYDEFANMNIVKKLNELGVGVMTEESIEDRIIDRESRKLYKRPFWTFARNSYGFASHASNGDMVDGIIYISSFACGIDSVVVELIKSRIGDFPFMILKLDEHTGEGGLETRVEAFVDMLERRR